MVTSPFEWKILEWDEKPVKNFGNTGAWNMKGVLRIAKNMSSQWKYLMYKRLVLFFSNNCKCSSPFTRIPVWLNIICQIFCTTSCTYCCIYLFGLKWNVSHRTLVPPFLKLKTIRNIFTHVKTNTGVYSSHALRLIAFCSLLSRYTCST